MLYKCERQCSWFFLYCFDLEATILDICNLQFFFWDLVSFSISGHAWLCRRWHSVIKGAMYFDAPCIFFCFWKSLGSFSSLLFLL